MDYVLQHDSEIACLLGFIFLLITIFASLHYTVITYLSGA